MTREDRQKLREAAVGDTSVEPVVLRANLLALLDYIDKIERDAVEVIESQRAEIERMRPAHEIGELTKARDTIDSIIELKRKALR